MGSFCQLSAVLPEVFANGENTFADMRQKASLLLPRFSIYSLLRTELLSVYARREKKRNNFIYA